MDYLHSDASIQGITLHIATGKLMYASSAFLDGKYRWREVADELESFEPDWPSALEFLRRAHEVWMASWANLSDADLEKTSPTFEAGWFPPIKSSVSSATTTVGTAGKLLCSDTVWAQAKHHPPPKPPTSDSTAPNSRSGSL